MSTPDAGGGGLFEIPWCDLVNDAHYSTYRIANYDHMTSKVLS